MKSLWFGYLSLFIGLLFSCGPSLQVSYDYDSSVDFTQYKTFRFGDINMNPKQISEFNRKRIIRAVAAEMVSKGFVHDTTNPDVKIYLFAKSKNVKQRTGTINNTVRYGGGNPGWYGGYPGYYRSGWGMTMTSRTPVYEEYTDGTLIIDIVEADKEELLWQGVGHEHVTYWPEDPAEIEARINKSVKAIMQNFPPE